MANILNINIREVQRRRQVKERFRCGTPQIAANFIAVGTFTLLMFVWQHVESSAVTTQTIFTVALVVLAPMLSFINLPSCCWRPPLLDELEYYDDFEQEAVASLASGR